MRKAQILMTILLWYQRYSQSKFEGYIEAGLKNNEVIMQHNFDINKACMP
ncbi:hypothetical protein [Flavobacterium sp. H122]|nr:hypothetical protein [Flavobacterium sp. H122]